jgi:peptidyl-prolyl cis-trans isomerase D
MIKNFRNENIDTSNDNFNEFINKQNSNNKKSILKSYDMLLSDKYNITLNQKTIERVKNYFQ